MSAARSRTVAAAGAIEGWRRRHPAVAAVLVLLALLVVWFWPLLVGRQMGQNHVLYSWWPWMADTPPGFDVAPRSGEVDAVLVFEPLLQLARRQIHDGQLPLWNPHSYGGMTLFGDLQTALLYPLTWIALVLPVPTAWGIMMVGKLLTAGVGTYALARHYGVRWGGAVVAATVFMFSAPLIVWLQWPLATVFSLFPLLILTTDRLAQAPGRRRVAALGAVVGLSILAGHPESAMLSSTAAGVYLLVRLLAVHGRRARTVLVGLAAWVAAHLVGLLVAAAALVPFYDAWRDSITRVAHEGLAKGHVPLWSAVVYAMPELFGDGSPGYVGPPLSYLIVAATFGVTAAILAIVALAARWRRPVALALLAMSVAALGVAFGVPPISWFMENVPPYATGNNSRVFYVVALAGAVGAGVGVDLLSRRALSWRRVVLWIAGTALLVAVGVGAVQAFGGPVPRELKVDAGIRFAVVLLAAAACLAALGRVARPAAVGLVIVVVVGELFYLQPFNVMLPPSQAYPRTPAAISYLAARPGVFHASRFRRSGTEPEVFPPDTNAPVGVDSPAGYDFPQSRRWSDFAWYVLGERSITREVTFLTPLRPQGPALIAQRMINTRWYLAPPGTPAAPSLVVRARLPGATVLEDPAALPRAYVVPSVREQTDAQALTTLVRGQLDPRRQALVPPGRAATAGPATAAAMRPAVYRRLSPEHVQVVLPRGAGGWLVVADAYHRGWKANVDGREVSISPTNFAVMGVPVRAGDRVVDITLDRTPYTEGAALSVLGLLLLGLLALPSRRRRRDPALA